MVMDHVQNIARDVAFLMKRITHVLPKGRSMLPNICQTWYRSWTTYTNRPRVSYYGRIQGALRHSLRRACTLMEPAYARQCLGGGRRIQRSRVKRVQMKSKGG